jgi:hypothetical protein
MMACETVVMPGGTCADCGWKQGNPGVHQVAMTGAHLTKMDHVAAAEREKAEMAATSAHIDELVKENAALKVENADLKLKLEPSSPPPPKVVEPPVEDPLPLEPKHEESWSEK